MDKLQIIVIVLLVLAIVFSVASVAMNIYLSNLKPVTTARAVSFQGTRDTSGNLEVGILSPAGGAP